MCFHVEWASMSNADWKKKWPRIQVFFSLFPWRKWGATNKRAPNTENTVSANLFTLQLDGHVGLDSSKVMRLLLEFWDSGLSFANFCLQRPSDFQVSFHAHLQLFDLTNVWIIIASQWHSRVTCSYSDTPQYRTARDQQISIVVDRFSLLPI